MGIYCPRATYYLMLFPPRVRGFNLLATFHLPPHLIRFYPRFAGYPLVWMLDHFRGSPYVPQ